MRVIRDRIGLHATAPIRAAVVFLLLVLTELPAAAQDDAPETLATAIGEILSAGAPPVTDIDAALGSEALAALKQVYAARNDRPIWLGSDAGRALLDRLSQPDVIVGPKLTPLLDDARKLEGLAIIRKAGEGMADQARRLLEEARAEMHTLDQVQVRVDLRDVLELNAATFEGLSQSHSIVATIPADDDVSVDVDPAGLQQILGHLLENAVKYSPPGTTVRMRARRDGRDVLLEVIDERPVSVASREPPRSWTLTVPRVRKNSDDVPSPVVMMRAPLGKLRWTPILASAAISSAVSPCSRAWPESSATSVDSISPPWR